MSSRQKERKEGKRQRIGFGGHRTRLQLPQEIIDRFFEEGYILYWHTDDKGMIGQAKAAGYEFVYNDEIPEWAIGEGELHQENSSLDSRVNKTVDSNPPRKGFLMKQKIEHYNEDRAGQAGRQQLVYEALQGGNAGGANIENQYVPKGGGVQITRS